MSDTVVPRALLRNPYSPPSQQWGKFVFTVGKYCWCSPFFSHLNPATADRSAFHTLSIFGEPCPKPPLNCNRDYRIYFRPTAASNTVCGVTRVPIGKRDMRDKVIACTYDVHPRVPSVYGESRRVVSAAITITLMNPTPLTGSSFAVKFCPPGYRVLDDFFFGDLHKVADVMDGHILYSAEHTLSIHLQPDQDLFEKRLMFDDDEPSSHYDYGVFWDAAFRDVLEKSNDVFQSLLIYANFDDPDRERDFRLSITTAVTFQQPTFFASTIHRKPFEPNPLLYEGKRTDTQYISATNFSR